MSLAAAFAGAIAGAAVYRLRGSGWFLNEHGVDGENTFQRRIFWGAATGLFVALLTLNAYVGLAVAVACFVGISKGHGKYFLIGPNDHPKHSGYRPVKNVAIMSLIGIYRLGLVALPCYFLTPDALALIPIGGLHGLAYYAGWKLHGRYKVEGIAWGEYFTGAYTWAALALILGG
jgi:hypothetical protein